MALTITYPTDLLRRRLQLQGYDSTVPKYNGFVDAIKKIIRQKVVFLLFIGDYTPIMLKASLNGLSTFILLII